MIKKIKQFFLIMIGKLKGSFQRFPETITLSFISVIIGILLNHKSYNQRETLSNILLILIMGLVISAIIKLVIERKRLHLKWRIGLDILLALGLVIFYLLLPKELDNQFYIRYVSAMIIFLLTFTLVPYFVHRKLYTNYFIKLISSFFITYLYTFVLFLGTIAMIFTVDKLFNINMDSKIYFDLFIITTGLFGVSYFLGSIPAIKTNMGAEQYPLVFRVLFISIVMPLLTTYTMILYAYFLKILIERAWPEGLVGNLVLWYGWISMVILFFTLEIGGEKTWASWFKKVFPIAFFIPLGMLFSAIWIRTNHYGVTIPRYYVWISALWFLIISLYYIINKNKKATFIISSLILFILVSAFTPLGSQQISIRSQNNHLEKVLKKNGMIVEGKIIKNNNISNQDKEKISSIINYMDRIDSMDQLAFVPENFRGSQTEEVFGFAMEYGNYEEYFGYYLEDYSTIIDVSQYDYLIPFSIGYQASNQEIKKEPLKIQFNTNNQITIYYQEEIIFDKSADDIAMELHQKLNNVEIKNQEELTFAAEHDKATIEIMISDLSGKIMNGGSTKTDSMTGKIYIKIK